MHRFKTLSGVVALVACAQVLSTSASASPVVPKGTLVGSVVCGGGPAAHAVVSIDGTGLGTHTDGSGQFRIDVPAQSSMTVEASPDAAGSLLASRYNVSVQPGETLDIGSLNLQVCPSPQPADLSVQDASDQSPNAEPTVGND